MDVLRAIGQAAVNMATFLGVWIQRIISGIGGFFAWLWNRIVTTKNNFSSLVAGAASMGASIVNRFKALPGQIMAAIGNLGAILYNAGKSLMQGLINGIRNKINELLGLLSWIAGKIGGFFGSSPAIEGALSGRGWTKFRGQSIMKGLIEGIQMEIPELRRVTAEATSNVVFGRDSVQVNFQGTAPTESQARSVGTAVGTGAANLIAARNTRLAVRTL
jgi:phage-related protein